MNKTVLVKILVSEIDAPRLRETFSDYKLAWQYVSDFAFNNKILSRTELHKQTYSKVRELVPRLNSALVQQARNDSVAKLKSVISNKHKIFTSPKLKNISIRYDNRTSSIKGNILSLSVNGGDRIKVLLQDFPFLNKHKTYKTLAPLIFFKDGEYWVALTFDIPTLPSKDGIILGIDLGLRVLAATSSGKLIRGNKMNRLRRKTRYLKKNLQSKGTKSSKRHLRRIRRKEQRQSRDVIHNSVNEILKIESSIIAIENLNLKPSKYRKAKNRRRFSVPLSEFVRILEYKSALLGKKIVKINPYFTSQDDCRGLKRGKRIGGKYVGIDGKILHADINAACNIAFRASLELNNPMISYYQRQVEVNQPIVGGSGLQAV